MEMVELVGEARRSSSAVPATLLSDALPASSYVLNDGLNTLPSGEAALPASFDKSRFKGFATALLALWTSACADAFAPTAPSSIEPIAGVRPAALASELTVQCQVSLRSNAMTCGANPVSNTGRSSVLLGGQGALIRLASSNVSYNSGTSIFQFDATIHNLMAQALGSTDGSTAHPDGIRLVLSATTVTSGSGSISAINADGTGTFTAPSQPYWQYSGNLASGAVSTARSWQLSIPSSVVTFTFRVLVSAAVPAEGGILRWTGQSSGTTNDIHGLSCTSTSHCVAVGGSGSVSSWNGTNWTSHSTGTSNWLYDVSCTSTSHCVAVGASGTILSWNGTSWSDQTSGTTANLQGVYCQGSAVCVAVASDGRVLRWNGSAWNTEHAADGIWLNSVQCVAVDNCVAVGGAGALRRWNGTAWNSENTGAGTDLLDVHCSSTNHCVAVGNTGVIRTWNGTNWSPETAISASDLGGVACPSSTYCLVVGDDGTLLAWNGAGWSTQNIGSTASFIDVACTSSTHCLAAGTLGVVRLGSRSATVTLLPEPCALSDLAAGLRTGLTAFYPFCGNADNVIGNGSNGTVTNASLVAGYSGMAQGAYQFVATATSGGRITLPWSSALGPLNTDTYTVAFWVRNSGHTWHNHVIYQWRGFASSIELESGRIDTHIQASGSLGMSHAVIGSNWTHVAWSRSGTSVSIYINGLLDRVVTTNLVANNATDPVYLAWAEVVDNPAGGYWFNGALDQLMVYNRTLSATEIRSLVIADL
jgi:hypothetical protein